MQTNKQTAEIVDSTIKVTRRQMFQIFNILPWSLLVLVLICGMIYFHNQIPVKDIVKSPTTLATTSLVQNASTNLNIPTNTVAPVAAPVNTEILTALKSLEKISKANAKRLAILEAAGKVEPIAVPVASPVSLPRVVVPNTPENSPVYTASDAMLAERLGYDLQKEITEQSLAIIEKEFGKWDGTESSVYTMRDNLKVMVRDSIKRAFDGFSTYNKVNGR